MLIGIKYLSKQRKTYTLLVFVYHARSLLPLCVPGRAGKDWNSDESIRVKGQDEEENCLEKDILTKVQTGKLKVGGALVLFCVLISVFFNFPSSIITFKFTIIFLLTHHGGHHFEDSFIGKLVILLSKFGVF